MSDRRMLALICLIGSFGYIAWIVLDEGSGPRVTTMIENMLGIPHILAAGLHLLGLAVLIGIGLRLLFVSSAQ